LTFSDLNQHEFMELYEQKTVPELAVILGVNIRTIQRWRAKIEAAENPLTFDTNGSAIAFPENVGPEYNKAISLKSDRVLLLGDAEIPDHSQKIFEAAIAIAKKFGLKDLIITGDLIALDSFSKWMRAQVYQLAFREELDPMIITIKVFLQTFDRIIYISGNHERRLNHAVDGHINIGDFLTNIPGLEFSEYAYCNLRSGNRDWLICHQKNFSVVPLSVPTKISEVRQKNVWCAHNHRLAAGKDKSGKYHVVEGGHCRSVNHTAYKMLQVTCHPEWNAGFGMIINGYPYLIDEENLDFWLSIELPSDKKFDKKKRK
jgi:hypothetical protein